MGRKNQARKGRTGTAQGGAMDSLSSDLSDLFKTLPPIKRADLTKTVEKLFQVLKETPLNIFLWFRAADLKPPGLLKLLQ